MVEKDRVSKRNRRVRWCGQKAGQIDQYAGRVSVCREKDFPTCIWWLLSILSTLVLFLDFFFWLILFFVLARYSPHPAQQFSIRWLSQPPHETVAHNSGRSCQSPFSRRVENSLEMPTLIQLHCRPLLPTETGTFIRWWRCKECFINSLSSSPNRIISRPLIIIILYHIIR